MGIAALKKLNQNMPDGLKQLAAPVIRRQLTGNRIFLEQYEECERAKAMSEDELAALQLAKLQELLAFAYENVPYYRETFDEAGFDPAACADAADLQRLPLLTKSALRERFDDLQAESVTDYYLATTGGSTGEPTKVNLERASIYRERAFVYSFWARTGYDYRASRVATLRGVDFGGKIVKQDPLYGAILLNPFMLNESNVAQYVREIERFGATFLHGYPSAIQNFCRLLKKTGTRPPRGIKCAFFISEGVNERQMAIVREVLGCPTRAFYGHSERSVFAEQRGDALEYEFNPLYGVTEVVPHASGNVVCTGFLNRRMPLIRYAVDDWAERVDGATTIEGHHTADYLVGAGGERITQTALNFHDASMDAVMGYQMVQRRSGRATLRVCSDHVLDAAELAAIRAALERKVGESIVWDVEQVDELELTARGKVPSIVSSLAGETLRGGVLRDYRSPRWRIRDRRDGRALHCERARLPRLDVRAVPAGGGLPVRAERARRGHVPPELCGCAVRRRPAEHRRCVGRQHERRRPLGRHAGRPLRADFARQGEVRRETCGCAGRGSHDLSAARLWPVRGGESLRER